MVDAALPGLTVALRGVRWADLVERYGSGAGVRVLQMAKRGEKATFVFDPERFHRDAWPAVDPRTDEDEFQCWWRDRLCFIRDQYEYAHELIVQGRAEVAWGVAADPYLRIERRALLGADEELAFTQKRVVPERFGSLDHFVGALLRMVYKTLEDRFGDEELTSGYYPLPLRLGTPRAVSATTPPPARVRVAARRRRTRRECRAGPTADPSSPGSSSRPSAPSSAPGSRRHVRVPSIRSRR